MADGWQLTQGGAKVRRKSTIVGGASKNYIILTETTEQPDLRKEILK